MNFRCFLALSSVLIFTGCQTTSGSLGGAKVEFGSMTTAMVHSCISVKNDRLDTNVEFNTLNCYQTKNGLLGIVWNDQFIRAFKAKSSGDTHYQIYTTIFHSDWTFPMTANFGIDAVQSVDGNRVNSDVDCSYNSLYGYCIHEEHFVFEIPEAELELVAANYRANPDDYMYEYRIKTQSGLDIDRVLHKAEITALLERVKSYRIGS